MKIIFLGGNVSGETVTRFVAAIGMVAVSSEKRSTILLQTIRRENETGFRQLFTANTGQAVLCEEVGRYMVGGMDYLLKKQAVGKLSVREIERSMENVIPGKLSFVPGSEKSEQYTLEELCRTFRTTADLCEEKADLVLIDGGGYEDADYLQIDENDRVVVLFDNDFVRKGWNDSYLFCNYHAESFYNIQNIMRMFHLKEETLYAVSGCKSFNDSCRAGDIRRFFEKKDRKFLLSPGDETLFLMSLHKTVRKLIGEASG